MLVHLFRGCLLGAIGPFLTGGLTAMAVGAKGIVLIFNVIAFVQSECLEKGVTIQG